MVQVDDPCMAKASRGTATFINSNSEGKAFAQVLLPYVLNFCGSVSQDRNVKTGMEDRNVLWNHNHCSFQQGRFVQISILGFYLILHLIAMYGNIECCIRNKEAPIQTKQQELSGGLNLHVVFE